MRLPTPVRTALALLTLLVGACATSPSGDAGFRQHRDRSLLTYEELNEISYSDAYQAVEMLRSNWLRNRGPASPNSPGGVQVYLNNTRLGGVEALRGLSTREIVFIRYYDPASAAGRWGRDVSHGVIFVSTERQ